MSKEIKSIYEFLLDKEVEADEPVVLEQNGEKINGTKKVKKLVPQKFIIRKPNRTLRDDADFYSQKVLSESIKQGAITVAGLNKIIQNEGGVLSEADKEKRVNLYSSLLNAQNRYQRLQTSSDKTDEVKIDILNVEKEIADLSTQIRDIEYKENRLYSNTAESRAQQKTLFWWTLMLAYHEVDGKILPYFGEGTFSEKLKRYDELEELDDKFVNRIIDNFTHYTTIIFLSNASDTESINRAIKEAEKIISSPK